MQNSPDRTTNFNGVLSPRSKRNKKYDMFNRPELTGSVFSKKRNNTQYDRNDYE